jgi:pimeloyl-ACP methyl ester carboxylesterase
MISIFVVIAGAIVALVGRLGLKSSPVVRSLIVAIRLPRHRAALAAMCASCKAASQDATATMPIHMTEWGTAGPTVLLIHGGVQGELGGGPATFREQKVLAEHGWQLLVPDRPGFRESPTRGPDDMEADSIWVATSLGDGAHLVGHSFGGAVALLAAARRPSAVRSLILIEPALIPLLPGSKVMRRNKPAREDFLSMGEAWLKTRTPAEYALTIVRDLGVVSRTAPDAIKAGEKPDAETANALGCALLQARLASGDEMRKAAKIVSDARIPVLFITGGWKPTFEAVAEIGAEVTGGRHVIIPAPNHFVQLVAPDAFNETIVEFMKAADAKRRLQ